MLPVGAGEKKFSHLVNQHSDRRWCEKLASSRAADKVTYILIRLYTRLLHVSISGHNHQNPHPVNIFVRRLTNRTRVQALPSQDQSKHFPSRTNPSILLKIPKSFPKSQCRVCIPRSKNFTTNFQKTSKSTLCLYSAVVLLVRRAQRSAGERAAGPEFEIFIANFLLLFIRYFVAYDFECGRGSKFVFLLHSCLYVSRFQIRLCVFVVPFLFDKNTSFAVVAVHCCRRVLFCSWTRRRSREH